MALLLLILAGNAQDAAPGTGRSIYQRGIGQDPIAVEMFGQRVERSRTFTCAACHGEYGAGGSEGGVVAPALIVDERLPDGTVESWLARALSGEHARSGERTPQRMPRFTMSARDRLALAGYIRALPNPPIPGLTSDRLVVGLEASGMGLDEAGRAALMSEVTTLFAKLANYGLYGRRVDVRDVTGMGEQADVFVAIMWDPRTSISAPLRLSVRPIAANGGDDLCVSIQPPIADQYELLTNHLERLGVRYRTSWDGAAPPFPLPAPTPETETEDRAASAEIHLGHVLPALSDRPVYVFADLIGPTASTALGANVHLLVPARIAEQEAAALDLRDRHTIDPRSAGAIAIMKKAARITFTVLARSGRRVLIRDACDRLAKSVRQFHLLDDLNNGTVSEIGADA